MGTVAWACRCQAGHKRNYRAHMPELAKEASSASRVPIIRPSSYSPGWRKHVNQSDTNTGKYMESPAWQETQAERWALNETKRSPDRASGLSVPIIFSLRINSFNIHRKLTSFRKPEVTHTSVATIILTCGCIGTFGLAPHYTLFIYLVTLCTTVIPIEQMRKKGFWILTSVKACSRRPKYVQVPRLKRRSMWCDVIHSFKCQSQLYDKHFAAPKLKWFLKKLKRTWYLLSWATTH